VLARLVIDLGPLSINQTLTVIKMLRGLGADPRVEGAGYFKARLDEMLQEEKAVLAFFERAR